MKSLVIKKEDSGQRIDKFLCKYLKRLPSSLMYKYIRKKRIKLNGAKCEISQKVKVGDILDLYINDEFFSQNAGEKDFLKAPESLNIIYEDENLMLIDKKPGLIVHPDKNVEIDCLINRIKKYLYNKGEYKFEDSNTFSPSLVNRIDRNTGGIVIAAKNAIALRELNEKMKNREIKKYYLCKVSGKLTQKEMTCTAYLKKDTLNNIVTVSKFEKEDFKKIITKYKLIQSEKNESLLEVELLTGRTHQIRAHLAHLGHPILGDGKYGLNRYSKKYPYQALYSYKIKFDFLKSDSFLGYMNKKVFSVKKVWFCEDFTS